MLEVLNANKPEMESLIFSEANWLPQPNFTLIPGHSIPPLSYPDTQGNF